MGAWSFVQDRIRDILRSGRGLFYAGRPRSASPATGSHKRHLAEQEAVVSSALDGPALEASSTVMNRKKVQS